VTGNTYTPFQRITAGTFGWNTSNDVQIEPQGSFRNDRLNLVDLRLEKVFNASFNRFGIYVDVDNLFNVGTVLTRQTRFPGASITSPTGDSVFVDFGGAASVTAARQATFGLRWSF
jgi:hypothetical protein